MSSGVLQRLALPSGGTIAYRDEGGSAATPILLLHGITEDHSAWDELAALLSRRARVVRVDLPGHGASSPLVRYEAGAITSALTAFVSELGLARPHVVGHSLGGLLATLLAARVPVRSVVNIDQALRLGDFIDVVRALAPGLTEAGFTATMNAAMDAIAGPLLSADVRASLARYRVPERLKVVTDLWLPLLDTNEEAVLAGFAPALARIDAPYLALHGVPLPAGYAVWLRSVVAGADTEIWPGTGHWLHRVMPQRFVDRVARFHAAAD